MYQLLVSDNTGSAVITFPSEEAALEFMDMYGKEYDIEDMGTVINS